MLKAGISYCQENTQAGMGEGQKLNKASQTWGTTELKGLFEESN